MSDRGQVLQEAIEIINNERLSQYGDPEDSFALIARYWEVYLNECDWTSGYGIMIEPKDVAMMMTLFKIAREAHQHKRDNLVDAAGYLGIAGDMCEDKPDSKRDLKTGVVRWIFQEEPEHRVSREQYSTAPSDMPE